MRISVWCSSRFLALDAHVLFLCSGFVSCPGVIGPRGAPCYFLAWYVNLERVLVQGLRVHPDSYHAIRCVMLGCSG